jgi:hypothetical protein
MDVIASALGTIFSPVVLFFALGFGAGWFRSSLAIPEAVGKGLALYLMLAIGFKGGVEMAHAGLEVKMLATVGLGIVAGLGLPVIAYAGLRAVTKLGRIDAAAVAAHYGSISVVTFVAATDYVKSLGATYDGYLIAVVAVMETPAIVAGLWLAQRGAAKDDGVDRKRQPRWDPELMREVFLNGSVVLLMGSLVIGAISGDDGYEQVRPFIDDPFKGVLCLFLLDMGIGAASRLRAAEHLDRRLAGFGVVMPLIGAMFGLGGGALLGLSAGSTTLFAVLCASASYIAVPAAMKVALPKANPAYSLTLSLGITFPFNVVFGIPLYWSLAQWILG